jgi:glutamyl-Q tRNA(Asp) synthetase
MFVTRFAPSPTGLLHLGHAFSALLAYEAAMKAGGRFLLRIEDIDATRCKREFEAAIVEDLDWLGLSWEKPVRRQSDHMSEYYQALTKLIKAGLVYRCFKTRKEVLAGSAHAPHGPMTAYRGSPLPAHDEAAHLTRGDGFAWRLSLDACLAHLAGNGRLAYGLMFEADGVLTHLNTDLIGDIVIARKEFPTSYHLACVSDDALQGVTHIIRGVDLIEAAHAHVLLQALLGLPTPVYAHHRLILDGDGKRLAKRDQSVTLRALREKGVTPDEIRAQVGLTTRL